MRDIHEEIERKALRDMRIARAVDRVITGCVILAAGALVFPIAYVAWRQYFG